MIACLTRTYTFSMEGRRLTTHWGGESIKLNMAEQWEGEHGYSPKNHNHDSKYAKLGHTHAGIGDLPAHNHDDKYSKLGHGHNYASSNHNHDTVYSKLGHVHDYAASNHNHDDVYSKLGHSHELIDMLPVGTVLWFKSNVTLSNKWTVYTDLIGRYPRGATSNLGGTVEAASPNITGTFYAGVRSNHIESTYNPTGAISYIDKYGASLIDGDRTFWGYKFDFDASRCSSVYKDDCDTVTPPSVNLIPYIKIA